MIALLPSFCTLSFSMEEDTIRFIRASLLAKSQLSFLFWYDRMIKIASTRSWGTLSFTISKESTGSFPAFWSTCFFSSTATFLMTDFTMLPVGRKIWKTNIAKRTGWFSYMSRRYMLIKCTFVLCQKITLWTFVFCINCFLPHF